MTLQPRNFWQNLFGAGRRESEAAPTPSRPRAAAPAVDIAPDDPIIAYFQNAPGAVEIDKLDLDSPALRALKASGVKLAVALVSQGELIGLLNLGPRLSEQDYSADDRALLSNLATQAGPAVRVAQLVRQQQVEAQARANDPLYEMGCMLFAHGTQEKFWQDTLTALAKHFEVKGQVGLRKGCVDSRWQWSRARNV